MSDSQSFPFESKTHPKLWEASWSVQERYSQLDIADVIEFARMRGIRVMVEFDVRAATYSVSLCHVARRSGSVNPPPERFSAPPPLPVCCHVITLTCCALC